MRIRFGLAYSALWERSTRITRAYHDVILWILQSPPPPRSLHMIQGQPPQQYTLAIPIPKFQVLNCVI